MKSHTCEFSSHDLWRLVAPPLLPVLVFALLMHLGAKLNLLPTPRPTFDTDRTIIIHQAESSRRVHDAEILLLGDSSCLMDVSARLLGEQLGRRALSLATLSFLDLAAHASLLRDYAAANPDRVRAVVLLMHPQALWRLGSEPYHEAVLARFRAGQDHSPSTNASGRVLSILGVDICRGRLLSRALPSPLAGVYGAHYGFSDDLEGFMDRERGSAVDPGDETLEGKPDYRLSSSLKAASRDFRQSMPPGARLFIGLTPTPARLAGPGFGERHAELLRQWAELLQADAALMELPAMLPDDQFARATHLKPAAVPGFSEKVAQAIQSRLK